MDEDPWSVSVTVVNDEVVVDHIIPFDDDFPEGTWVLDGCIWASERGAHYVAQKRIKTSHNRREKNVIWQVGNLGRLYSVQEFIDLKFTQND